MLWLTNSTLAEKYMSYSYVLTELTIVATVLDETVYAAGFAPNVFVEICKVRH